MIGSTVGFVNIDRVYKSAVVAEQIRLVSAQVYSCGLTGKPSTFLSRQYRTVALIVCSFGSHLAIFEAIAIASASCER